MQDDEYDATEYDATEHESAELQSHELQSHERQATGDDRVDAALDRLGGLDELPLAAQVTVFDDVHRLLQDALTGNEASGSGDPGR